MPTRPYQQCPPAATHVFVYGTLRKGHGHRMADRLATQGVHLGRALWRGRLYDLGSYPAAVRTAGGTDVDHVVGDVYRLDDPGLLSALDDYEAHDPTDPRPEWYVRDVVPVVMDDGRRLDAYIYRYTGTVDPRQRIRGGDYLKHLDRHGAPTVEPPRGT